MMIHVHIDCYYYKLSDYIHTASFCALNLVEWADNMNCRTLGCRRLATEDRENLQQYAVSREIEGTISYLSI
ncbi:hypothetical protein IEQ34_016161 [Dendrobium chrysotoxum]|uniref:Uncharacterized protein n=1 Tax=Dendrobium chrysotoxum TaxID=161865 RepID=A0AAV7GEJ5_DENCH|nr:hypothetical protein IEQ34_016161 [Dendrobium chrysotoxum]